MSIKNENVAGKNNLEVAVSLICNETLSNASMVPNKFSHLGKIHPDLFSLEDYFESLRALKGCSFNVSAARDGVKNRENLGRLK